MSNKPATFSSLAEQNFRPLVLLLSGLLLFGSGMLLAKSRQIRNPPPIKYEVGAPAADPSKDAEISIKVDVSGAVNTPKVCELAAGSRVEDALDQAGGLSAEADRDWVSESLNLAAKPADGDKLYIPRRGEVVGVVRGASLAEVPQLTGGGSSVEYREPTVGGKVDINTAVKAELESLPGIGAVKAQAIIDYRAHNPFNNIEEIMEVKGIAGGIFEKIKDAIVVR